VNCFVTGAGGFIGRELCAALRARGDTVVAGLRRESPGPWNRTLLHDLVDSAPAPSDIADVQCVFHLAGKAHAICASRRDEEAYFRVNTEATRKLLERCGAAGVRRFVFLSSVKAAGESGAEVLDETAVCQPETPYGRSKLEAERLVLEGGYVPEPVVLRLSMVYGPTHKGNLPRMIEAIHRGRFPPLPETGNKRSMVHVADVVKATLLAADLPGAKGQTYIVTDERCYSTRQIYNWICEVLSKPVPQWTIPLGLLQVVAKVGDLIGGLRRKRFMFDSDSLDKLTGSAVYSSEKIRHELGFRPERDLRTALPEIVACLGLK
jgi:nucleoside-diphosphate-sugar epimerase